MQNVRPKSPGFVYAGLSLAILVVVGVAALTARQPPPPSIAEFAPQAVKQIREAPSDQGIGALGTAGTEAAEALRRADEAALSAAIEVPRVRKCVGDPPRQIEDPQSPPCVPYWDGDNGGATTKGVTANQINVVIENAGGAAQQASGARELPMKPLQDFFNKRFEFYGRKIVLSGAGTASTCTEQKAQANNFDEVRKAFAVGGLNGSASCVYDESARRKLIAVDEGSGFTEAQLDGRHPYLWTYAMSYEQLTRHLGRMACARLANRPANYTRDPLLVGRNRKFGIILHEAPSAYPLSLDFLTSELARCNAGDVIIKRYKEDGGGATAPGQHAGSDPSLAADAVFAMKTAGVTTVFCLCAYFVEQFIPPAATGQSYYPEWIMSSYGANDLSFGLKVFWPQADQRQSMFGLTGNPRQLHYTDEPAYWAVREVKPSYRMVDNNDLANAQRAYRPLLLIASGIQMAGPNLTPETFARGLQRARFPNPDHPIRAGRVGFQNGDHSMTEDAQEMWWSEAAAAPNSEWEGAGTFCYFGPRRSMNDWSDTRPTFFDPPCVVGAER